VKALIKVHAMTDFDSQLSVIYGKALKPEDSTSGAVWRNPRHPGADGPFL
jgi:hypothetical protein